MKKNSLHIILFTLIFLCLFSFASVAYGVSETWIDQTVDKSIAYVTGVVHLTGSGGTAAGYGAGKTVYSTQQTVTYSKPKSEAVQAKIAAAYDIVYKIANDLKNSGRGEFEITTSETTGQVWDHRRYDTVYAAMVNGQVGQVYSLTQSSESKLTYQDGSVTIEYDMSTNEFKMNGSTLSSNDYTVSRTHIATGEYGKETYYRVEANGWVDASGPVEKVTLSKLKSVKLTALSAKKLKIAWKKLSSKDKKKIKQIQIQVSTDKMFTTIVKEKFLKSSKTSWTIPGLKKNTKYFVRIRAYTRDGNVISVSKWVVKNKKTKKK